MNNAPVLTLLDFEVHLLMTMKLRISMSHKEPELEAKLAAHGLSVDDAQRIHERVAEALGDEASYFANLTTVLEGARRGATALHFPSVLWPGFDFKATAGDDGRLASARYWHTRSDSAGGGSPVGLPIWSMDVTEFTQRFGPMLGGRQWSVFDEYLPAYEEYEFLWEGQSYGAGFSWGLFMFTAMSWD